jgi:hypothetical protein
MVGRDENNQPSLWTSNEFDRLLSGPTSWIKSSASGAGELVSVAPLSGGWAAASELVGLLFHDGTTFQSTTGPDTARAVACDDAGVCVSSDWTDGAIYRSTDGTSYTSNGGTERLGVLEEGGGTFVAFDAATGELLWSSDGGVSWTVGDLSVFNVLGLAFGDGVWVATTADAFGSPTVWRSTDGGQTWLQVSDIVTGPVSFSATAGAFYAAGNVVPFPTVWSSSDGTSWTEIANLGEAGLFYTVVCH